VALLWLAMSYHILYPSRKLGKPGTTPFTNPFAFSRVFQECGDDVGMMHAYIIRDIC
jgi:hypothetical protein